MTTQEILTTNLRNGVKVLAKNTQFGINAYTYSNDKQAGLKQIQLSNLGIECSVYIPCGSSVRFIKLK